LKHQYQKRRINNNRRDSSIRRDASNNRDSRDANGSRISATTAVDSRRRDHRNITDIDIMHR
jgi:hypothetical protein